MRDASAGYLRLACVGCDERSPFRAETADGFGAPFDLGEAVEPRAAALAQTGATPPAPSRPGPSAARFKGRAREKGARPSRSAPRGARGAAVSARPAIVIARVASSPGGPPEWYEPCRFCDRGRLVATRDERSGRLFLGCGECAVGCSSRREPAEGFGALVAFADAFGVEAAQRLEGA